MLGLCFPARRFRSSDGVEGSDQVRPGTSARPRPLSQSEATELGLHRVRRSISSSVSSQLPCTLPAHVPCVVHTSFGATLLVLRCHYCTCLLAVSSPRAYYDRFFAHTSLADTHVNSSLWAVLFRFTFRYELASRQPRLAIATAA